MANINYTKTEQALLSYLSNAEEIALQDIEMLAERLDDGDTVWAAVELGRHPSTDRRTYTLHVYSDKPKFDYYGAEELNLEILGVKMVEIKSLGRMTVGAYKASFAIYECPVCKRHVQMNSYNVKHYNTQRCTKCKRSEHMDLTLNYIEEIQNVLGATLELKHSQGAQQLVRKYAKIIVEDIDRYGGRDITARLRTNKAELNFILEGVE